MASPAPPRELEFFDGLRAFFGGVDRDRALCRRGRARTALAVSVPLLVLLSVVTFAFPPAAPVTVPLKLLVAGCAVAYDFLDYPLGLRGAGVAAFQGRHFGATVGFGLAASLVLLIPGVGLLLLPFAVAGATRMVVLADRPRSV